MRGRERKNEARIRKGRRVGRGRVVASLIIWFVTDGLE